MTDKIDMARILPGSRLLTLRRRRHAQLAFSLIGAILALLPFAGLVMERSDVPHPPVDVPGAAGLDGLKAAVRRAPTAGNRLDLAAALIRAKQAQAAVPLLEALVAENPDDAVAWNNLCAAHNEQSDYGSAIRECANALRIRPSFELARNNKAWAEAKRDALSAQLAQRAAGIRNAAQLVDAAATLLRIGRYDEAIDAAQRALDLAPGNADAANVVGVAFMLKHQPKTALAWFRKAMSYDPSLVLARNNHAWAESEIAKGGRAVGDEPPAGQPAGRSDAAK